jgi:hypothetical protein
VGGRIESADDYICDYQTSECRLLVVDNRTQQVYELTGATLLSNGTMQAQCLIIWDMCGLYDGSIGLRGEQCTRYVTASQKGYHGELT